MIRPDASKGLYGSIQLFAEGLKLDCSNIPAEFYRSVKILFKMKQTKSVAHLGCFII